MAYHHKITAFIFAVLALSSLVYVTMQSQSPRRQSAMTAETNDRAKEPDNVPHAELTIPYLRERKYTSSLGERTQYETYARYTSYLTSYTSDELKINGLLTIPEGEMPAGGWPAIVFVHGYIPPTQYRTTEKYITYVDGLADAGFVVFKVDLRGHGESEGEPTGAYYASEYVVDVLNARAALSGSGIVNPAQIGTWGHSMAGNVTLRALAVDNTIPAVVIWAGAVFTYEDWLKYGLQDNSYRPPTQVTARVSRRNEIFKTHGEFNAQNDFWRRVVPVNYLERVGGAIQLHHPTDDTVVDVRYSRDLSTVLTEKNIEHEFYEYPTGGHNIESPSFELAMQRTIDFYKERLMK